MYASVERTPNPLLEAANKDTKAGCAQYEKTHGHVLEIIAALNVWMTWYLTLYSFPYT